ncbi:MAG: PaaX family transcriptional regulator C-terminal domain-containing protein [Pseudomonadota bacterium]|nr:PaaX family transcriptional regulator C-terminal domain-containing protein [Pseudomonadota bacterium]
MTDPIAPLVTALHGEGRLRLWSLVITAFGDLVQHRGGEISTARLKLLMGRIGVEQGTLRTALSRLGQDGWVSSTRQGRLSLYRLTPEGLAKFGPATTRIYAPPRAGAVDRWRLSVVPQPGGSAQIALTPADEAAPESALAVVGTLEQLTPEWRAGLITAPHRAALLALERDLDSLAGAAEPDPLGAAAARMLLIHRWRRIVLRYPEYPPEILPQGTPLPDARARVAQAYARLAAPAEDWLHSTGGGLTAMPPATRNVAQRFQRSDGA